VQRVLVDLKMLGDWKSVIGGALGLLSAAFTVLGPSLRDRNVHARCMAAYDSASKKLAYYDLWLKASLAAHPAAESDARALMKAAVDQVQTDLSQTLAQLVPTRVKDSTRSLVTRLLLLYKPPRARAWFPRAIFYALAALTSLGILVGIFDGEVRFNSDYWLGYLIIFLVCLAFRALARVME